jgi:hypothetical protein
MQLEDGTPVEYERAPAGEPEGERKGARPSEQGER